MCKLRWPAVALLTLSGLMVVICLLTKQLWPNLAAEAWASWAQAIGSIFALGVAIAVPAWQHDKAEKQRQKEQREYSWRTLRLVWLLTARANNVVELIGTARAREGFSETPEDRKYQFERMDEVRQALESIPLTSIPTLESIQYFMRVKRLVVEALQEINRCPVPTASMDCGKLYGQPWLRFHGELKEAVSILGWQADQHMDGNLELNEPSSIFS